MRRIGVLAALAAMGCGSTTNVVPPATIDLVSASNGQSAPAGGLLPAPLAVDVKGSDGTPAPRADVRWTVTTGSGAVLSDSVTQSDGDGRAEVTIRLGPTAGSYGVQAALKAAPGKLVAFTATATAPPVIASVSPSTFTGGDTIVVQGSGFETGAAVDVAGHPALVLPGGGATSLTVIVPVCLVPGSVAVQVMVRTAPSNTVPATFTAATAPVQLAVGEYASIDPTTVTGCARFPAAGLDSVKYLIAPQSVSGLPGDSATYRLLGDSALASVAMSRRVPGSLPFAVTFDNQLRELEGGYARLPRPAMAPRAAGAAGAAAATTLSVGQQRTFHVCDSLPCTEPADFAAVTATLMYVGKHAAIYQDAAAPANGFAASDFQSLGQLFDNDLYDVDTKAFGVESDVDQNGLVMILFTPSVNKLTPKSQCSTSFVTGFFFAFDIDPAFKTNQNSNQAEIFYAIVPDPQGKVACSFSTSAVRRLVPVTFIHEFQHMISYYHHVLLRNGSTEDLWLNEGMSHLAEELGGWHFLAQGDTTEFSNFAIGDLFNAFQYLKDPGARFAFFEQGTGTLEERGAAWLFLRWVLDQFGDDVTRRLSETGLRGTANVAAATGEPVAGLLPQWFLANYVSDLPGFTAPSRLTYSSWHFRKTFASLNQQSPTTFDRPFPLVPSAYLGGNFDVSGVLRAGSGDYFLAVQTPAQRGFGLQFTQGGGAPFSSSVPARLNVIRIR